MAKTDAKARNAKLSPQFAQRLGQLKPEETVRAIVLLSLPDAGSTPLRKESRANRQTIIADLKRSTEAGLIAVDAILERAGGRRLSAGSDVFGSIPIETTSRGVNALAASEYVRAILEDQGISALQNHG